MVERKLPISNKHYYLPGGINPKQTEFEHVFYFSLLCQIKVQRTPFRKSTPMRALIMFILAAFVCMETNATDYYFSSTSGSDSRSASEAANAATPWRSIAKFNKVFPTLKPGDRVLFKRGEVFYGKMDLKTASGTSSAPIVISAYGSGAKPVITGFIEVSNWVNKGNGVYETVNSNFPKRINMVSMNGAPKAIGRWPNFDQPLRGYMIAESAGTGYITDNELPSSPSWTGAEIVVRTSHWTIDRSTVSSHSGHTLKFSSANMGTPKATYGYFIQNDVRTLDKLGEWAYSSSAKRFSMYFGSNSPSNYRVRAANIDTLVMVYGSDHITFDNLAFEGSNMHTVRFYSSDHSDVQNCDFNLSGAEGIVTSITPGFKLQNCKFNNTHNTAISLGAYNDGSIIRGNTIKNSGVVPGMGPNGSNSNNGITSHGSDAIIEYNTIDSCGYNGIQFSGGNSVARYNVIRNFTLIKDDGGGIYMWGPANATQVGRKILNNIILDGVGAKEGTNLNKTQQSSGIYLDDYASNVEVANNTIARCGKVGLFVHNNTNITIRNNTCFDNTAQVMLNHDHADKPKLRKITMKNNVFISKTSEQKVGYFYSKVSDIAYWGSIDSNHYQRPVDENQTIVSITYLYTSSQATKNLTFDSWKGLYGHDRNSKKSARTYTSSTNPDGVFKFVVNTGSSTQTFPLSGTYVDARNKQYSGSITLAPFSSAVLMYTGSTSESIATGPTVNLTSPKVNATYTASASIRLTATASDVDGTISKVEFYKGTTLLRVEKVAPYDWTWTGVQAGTYTITAKAYDNHGKTTVSNAVTVIVKSGTSSITSNQTEIAMLPEAVESEKVSLNLFPNPATSVLNVKMSGNAAANKAQIVVSNLNGQVVLRQQVAGGSNPVALNIGTLPAGMYILNLIIGTEVTTAKFIKQ